MGNKQSKNNRRKQKRKNGKKKWKVALFILEILIIAILVFGTIMVFTPNAKLKLISALTGCAPGRSLVSMVLGADYAEYLQDKDFDEGNIDQNDDLVINEKYTNIALLGTDTRSGDLAKASHTDSIIIVSINNETGEVKMVSVYRDTILEFMVDNKLYYDKATNAFSYGGAETTINMLNANLDLNIKDYAIVNFAGLANIIDALGGIDIKITEEERGHLNNYLVETREVTGMKSPDVKTSGNVHLNGLQATCYCRIRYAAFTNEDGTTINNDFARAARQRLVLEKLVAKAKSAGVSELLDVSKALFSQNTGDDQFMVTSMKFNEIMDLIPTLIDFDLVGSQGFPSELSTGLYMPVVVSNKKQQNLYNAQQSSVFVNGLEYNVSELHKYLFGEEDYVPTKNVQEINDLLIDLTGKKAPTSNEEDN